MAKMSQDADLTETLNRAPLGLFHLRAVIMSGMGFFTDAYDLFIIGAALVLIKTEWHPTAAMVGLMGSTALVAAFVGAFVFGRLADLHGRKAVYGLVAGLMAFGAIGAALAPSMLWLIIFRFIMGLGIGGDYPVSAVLMSEYANTKDRGKLVGLVFSMQAVGLVTGPVVAMTLLAAGLPDAVAWRIMLGLGAIPAMAVIVMRLKMPESPRYVAEVRGDAEAAQKSLETLGVSATLAPRKAVSPAKRLSFREFIHHPRYLVYLIGTAGTWFFFDYAYYGNSISMPLVLKAVAPHASALTSMAWTLIVFAVFAVPGYILAVTLMDKIGHRKLQLWGFLIMGLAFGTIALVPHLTTMVGPFLLVFGVSYFFAEFGPNTTTFVLPSEIYPTSVRTTGHGISAGVAKFGAFLGTLLFPLLEQRFGLSGTLFITFLFALIGLGLTFLLPEPTQKSLEELARDAEPEAQRKHLAQHA
ncbi:MAG: MFS transporter [Firmicutes bacterium]|nr:MFS transporter [Bacillota bacterium]